MEYETNMMKVVINGAEWSFCGGCWCPSFKCPICGEGSCTGACPHDEREEDEPGFWPLSGKKDLDNKIKMFNVMKREKSGIIGGLAIINKEEV